MSISQVEQELKKQIDKNAEYKKKLDRTNNFIKKLAQILRCYRLKYKNEHSIGKDGKNSRNRSGLEYLCGEIYRVIDCSCIKKLPPKYLHKVQSMELLTSNLEHASEDEIANIMTSKESTQSLPFDEEFQSAYMQNHVSVDSLLSDNCECCFSKFTWFRWRHHCRMCGKLVCQSCSNYKGYVVGYSDKQVRICRDCFITKENARKKCK